MFTIKSDKDLPERELSILKFWHDSGIFKKTLEKTKEGPLFSFYDGPPFATGLPHYGHLLAGTIKDAVQRYQTMQGKYVPRRFGWDCHGLPVENEIEKAKNLSGAPEIEAFGIGKFNEECRSIVLRYTEEWKKTVSRMGRWVDFSETFHTMDKSYMESVWWVFSQLYEKGLVYEGFKVMPFSTKLGTPLSNFEANLNYKEVDDPSLTVAFKLVDEEETFLLAWTTTPWTLPSNLALAVHPGLDYVKVRDPKSARSYILAEALLPKHIEGGEVVAKFRGSELLGKRYEPLFPYFKDHAGAFRVLCDEFVSIEEGTGVVHMAPAFGEADFFICAKAGIEVVCPVNQNGQFTSEVEDFAGLYVKDADKAIIARLKREGKVYHHTQIHHRYPFCWRSDTPLIYKAVKTWFVAVEEIKDRLLRANREIAWVPSHIQEGRFGKWLENARDWAVSRNRYWGTPIPLWRSEDGEIKVISSVKELEELVGQEVVDLHRHYIDELSFEVGGKRFHRIPEVFDCWFESGSVPYAQNHYPFENKEKTERSFPADFIAEGLDQTRGWFYTLTVLAAALFDKPAFKNVIVNGIILAEDGNKMSKRLKNYPEPEVVIDEFGADAVRLYLLSSPAVVAEDLRFSKKGVELISRQILIPFLNAAVFFATYAKIYAWEPSKGAKPKAAIDRWIVSLTMRLTKEVTSAMESFKLQEALLPLTDFVEQLTNWYIRRSRARFWADDDTLDRREAFETLYFVLVQLSKLLAPFAPFLAEEIYQDLRGKDDLESVHLHSFPTYEAGMRDEGLEEEMRLVQEVASCGHALRKLKKLKVRQPLRRAIVLSSDEKGLNLLQAKSALIEEELNVKEVVFERDESLFVELLVKPNFRVLGKKVGGLMNATQKVIEKLPHEERKKLLRGEGITLVVEGQEVALAPEDVAIERKVKEGLVAETSGGITVALDTELSEELILEGIARDLVSRLNQMRKEAGLEVTDRIRVVMRAPLEVRKAFELHRGYICHEALITEVEFEGGGESEGADPLGEIRVVRI